MKRRPGGGCSRTAACLVAASLLAFAPPRAAAQDGDLVIVDPDREGTPTQTGSDAGDMVISDPDRGEAGAGTANNYGWGELSFGKGGKREGESGAAGDSSGEDEYDPLANTGTAHIETVGQFSADTRHEGDLEDAYETRLRFDLQIDFRRSRKLRLSVGVRTDLFWGMPARGDSALTLSANEDGGPAKRSVLDQDRFELDILPLAAYLDATLADGFHLRIGEQVVSMARMDFYSPIDILMVTDTRGQPVATSAPPKLAQPAVRMDWDLSSWATLQAIYVPWFMPNLNRANRDQYVGNILGPAGNVLPAFLDYLVDPSYQTQVAEQAVRFVGPAPDFTTPQAQARLTMRGSNFEFSLSGGTALEKWLMFYLTPLAEKVSLGNEPQELADLLDDSARLLSAVPLVDAEYHRFYSVGLDGNFAIGPVTIAFEAAYSPARYWYASTNLSEGGRMQQPNVSEEITDPIVSQTSTGCRGEVPVEFDRGNPAATRYVCPSNVTDEKIRRGVPRVEGALHIDWLHDDDFAVIAEAFWMNWLHLPHDETRDWWGHMKGTGAYVGGLLALSYGVGRWRFELAGMSMLGPSLIVMPNIEFRAREGLLLNLGAQFYEGREPYEHGQRNVNVGGLYSGYDNVFIGFRYLP